MALSFGGLIKPSTVSNVPFSLGFPTANSVKAKGASNMSPVLSYGSAIPRYTDPFATGVRLSQPASVPKSTGRGFFPSVSDFLSSASFGFEVGDTRQMAGVYDDGILRAVRNPPNPIPTVQTANIDGGSNILNALKTAGKAALMEIGSRGDGEIQVTQASYPAGQGGGINPLYIAAAALAAGAIYYVATK